MKIAIMQPTFNPWIGYFDLIDYVDKFIIFDTVQLAKRSWQTRNKIKVQDKELMISVPIKKTQTRDELLIKDASINFREFDFRKNFLRTIEQNYKKCKYYNETFEFAKELILFDTEYLSTYTINMIRKISEKLNIDTEILILSETDYKSNAQKGELILDICKYFNTDEYISPLGSKEYLDKVGSKFETDGIDIFYQYYNHPIYKQLGDNFIPYIGIFDLLYNEGFHNAKKIIYSGRNFRKDSSCHFLTKDLK